MRGKDMYRSEIVAEASFFGGPVDGLTEGFGRCPDRVIGIRTIIEVERVSLWRRVVESLCWRPRARRQLFAVYAIANPVEDGLDHDTQYHDCGSYHVSEIELQEMFQITSVFQFRIEKEPDFLSPHRKIII